MRSLDRITTFAGRFLAILAGAATLVTMLLICIDIVMRLFHSSFPGTSTIVANYLMIVVAYLPLAWIERNDGMITVDLFSPVPGSPQACISTLLVGVISLPIYIALTHATWLKAVDRLGVFEFETIPNGILYIWPSYFAIPVSLALAALVVLLRTIRALIDKPVDHQAPIEARENNR